MQVGTNSYALQQRVIYFPLFIVISMQIFTAIKLLLVDWLQMVKADSLVVVVTGWRQGSGFTNTVRIIKIPHKGTTPKNLAIMSQKNRPAARENAIPDDDSPVTVTFD